MNPRAGLEGCGKSRPAGIRSQNRPARSESLSRLSYPCPILIYYISKFSLVKARKINGQSCCTQRINMRTQLDYITWKVRDHLLELCLNERSVR